MSIFKKTDPVYVYPDGWGEVLEVENDLVKIDFGKRYAYHKSYEVSFTKYNLVKGGFSQERPDPKLEVGKSYRSKNGWVVINRSGNTGNYGFNPDGEFCENLLCSTHDYWQEIPESEAIELLEKECVKWGGEDWKDVKIKECLYRREDEETNSGYYRWSISIREIWNKNGCIFKKGVWTEKLEEPKIRRGQMIWVKNKEDQKWNLCSFFEFSGSDVYAVSKDGAISLWGEYSITNPNPYSIEARAIDILRRIYDADEDSLEYRESIVSTQEFLKEIDSYEK